MGCFGCGHKIQPDEHKVPIKVNGGRKCTDCLFLLLFIAFWGVLVIIAMAGLDKGEPERLIYGKDYTGTVCGTAEFSDKKYVYYPKIGEDLDLFSSTGNLNPLDIDLFGICVEECPQPDEQSIVCLHDVKSKYMDGYTSDQMKTKYLDCSKTSMKDDSDCKQIRNGCWLVPLETSELFYRCLWKRDQEAQINDVCTLPLPCDNSAGVDNPIDCLATTALNECYYTTTGEFGKCDSDQGNQQAVTSMKSLDSTSYTNSDFSSACITTTQYVTSSTTEMSQSSTVLDKLYDTMEVIARWVGDIQKTWFVILLTGMVLALLAGFFYIYFLKIFVGIMIWLIIWLVMFASIGATVFCFSKAGYFDNSTTTDETTTTTTTQADEGLAQSEEDSQERFKYLSWAMCVVTMLLLVLVLWLRTRVKLAIAIMKEASKAMGKVPSVVLIPFITTVAFVVFFAYWSVIALYVVSAGDNLSLPDEIQTKSCSLDDLEDDCVVTSDQFETDDLMEKMLAVHFFGLLWNIQFISAIAMTTIAGSVAHWYWTAPNEKGQKQLGKVPVFHAFRRTIRYHLGTMALGSLIVAIIQFVRAVLYYLDKKSKKLQNKSSLLRVVFKMLHCCLWCFEKILKFVNKNAYIIVAMKGTGFCKSTKHAFHLIVQNVLRVGTVNFVSNFLLFLGKVAITIGCSIACFQWLDKDSQFQAGGDNEIDSQVLPTLLTAIIAYAVSSLFLSVYDMAIDTILLCYCEDEERVKQGASEFFASGSLRSCLSGLAEIKGAKAAMKQIMKDTASSKKQEGGKEEEDNKTPAQQLI
eukprot:TRINITY_DN3155_c0_g1_i1.p1 TRINITY_DN3155_c0_g1~~TRINITY_DN3155_c0_g1_i1.p1  ORF type:complete len:803 (+),score=176.36 TRINITY_DN3155_c0_g1_i1:81-2489(+)